jgi:protein O-GlcNAc transferase
MPNARMLVLQAIQLQPNFPEAYNNLGNTLRELGRCDEAIGCYTASIQLQFAQHPSPGANMAQVALMQSQRLSVAFSNLGGILKMQGQLVDAITCYEHVAILLPNLPEVQVRHHT